MRLVCFNVCPSHTGLCGDLCGRIVLNSAKVWCIRKWFHAWTRRRCFFLIRYTHSLKGWSDHMQALHFMHRLYKDRKKCTKSGEGVLTTSNNITSMHIDMCSKIHVHFYTLTKALTYQHIYSHCNIPEGNDSPTKKGILNWVEDPRHWSLIVTNIWARMPHKLQRTGHVLQAFSLTRSTSDLNTLVISWIRLRYR